ncbi:hypothetical protein PHAVU_003G178700 [Phaseolus vulgaris]|uniref:Uncharacterized protein n=1 Tax=Phaseolus vulgaris TaxID=3885 RepID=V7CAG5_PHAVU|nr:hypothetical protein PHAVU_003G178700g [Phaseolus vulgaris]ESW27157.1 hypothetical protein PHAVU_003G178700g [Phaseolus vulgaris]
MTTNLVECMDYILKRARSLPSYALIKTTFERTNSWFVERGMKAKYMVLHNIYKAFEIQFHPIKNKDDWSTYTSSYFIHEPHMRHKYSGRPITTRIHNEWINKLKIIQKNLLLSQ